MAGTQLLTLLHLKLADVWKHSLPQFLLPEPAVVRNQMDSVLEELRGHAGLRVEEDDDDENEAEYHRQFERYHHYPTSPRSPHNSNCACERPYSCSRCLDDCEQCAWSSEAFRRRVVLAAVQHRADETRASLATAESEVGTRNRGRTRRWSTTAPTRG